MPEIQEVLGVQNLSTNKLKHVVVAEQWPTIAFALSASLSQHIGVVVSSTIVSTFVNTLLTETESVAPGMEFCIALGSEQLASLNPDVVWIQGSLPFVTNSFHELKQVTKSDFKYLICYLFFQCINTYKQCYIFLILSVIALPKSQYIIFSYTMKIM